MPIPSLSTASKSGADGNLGGSLASSYFLNEGDWNIATGSAPAPAISFNKALIVAAIGGVLWWMSKKRA